jgi:hypothetical protein
MNSLIQELVKTGTFTRNGSCKFSCKCGQIVPITLVSRHLKGRHHKSNLARECLICFEQQNKFVKCAQCSKECCHDCFSSMLENSEHENCPFCRFPVSRDKVYYETVYKLYEKYQDYEYEEYYE